MKDRLEITSLAQLRLLAHPLRLRIIRLYSGERVVLSVKQMADRLGEPHGKVHYHVRKLVDGGFLEPAGEQLVNGIVERFYRMGARSIDISPAIRELPGYQGLLQQVADNLFGEGIQKVYQEAVDGEGALRVQFHDVFMTQEEVAAFMDRLEPELERYAAPRPGTVPVRWVVLASHPRVEESQDGGVADPRDEDRPSGSEDPKGPVSSAR